MPLTSRARRRAVLLSATLVAISACAPSDDPAGLEEITLTAGTYALVVADGQTLPAMVYHRQESDDYIQTFVDSSLIDIRANGSYEQRVFLRDVSFTTGAVVREEPILFTGAWEFAGDSTFGFTSVLGIRHLLARPISPGDTLDAVERYRPSTAVILGRYGRR